MNAAEIIIGILILIVSIIAVFIVLMQEGHRHGINGAISGGADTFLSKNKAKTFDKMFATWTKYIVISFFVLAVAANIVSLLK